MTPPSSAHASSTTSPNSSASPTPSSPTAPHPTLSIYPQKYTPATSSIKTNYVLSPNRVKKVSTIITTHNRERLLRRAVESVLSQSYPNIELIVIDDNSSDGTKDYCASMPDIKYVYIAPEESKGGNYARNKGIAAATGEYVAFLDDDDYWLPEKIEKQVELIERTGCGLVYCGFLKEVVTKDIVKHSEVYPLQENRGDMSVKILTTIPTTTSNILVTAKALKDVSFFDESLRFWQEYELLIRLSKITSFDFVNEVLAVYRIDTTDSVRLTNKYDAWKKAVEYIYFKHKDRYSKLNTIEKLYARALVWNDARKRSKASGKKTLWLMYAAMAFPVRAIRRIRRAIGFH